MISCRSNGIRIRNILAPVKEKLLLAKNVLMRNAETWSKHQRRQADDEIIDPSLC